MRENPLQPWIDRYGPKAGQDGPVLFVREVLGAEPDDWQIDVLRAYGRGERRIAARSAHGVGKTAVAAWKVVYQACCRYPQRTVATAPTSGQLKGALVPEIKRWFKKLPPVLLDLFEIQAMGVYYRPAPEESYFEARTSRAEKPEALAGVHSKHVLLIADEASGVPEQVFEAALGGMSDTYATLFLIGNPIRSSGLFFDAFHGLRDMWYRVHIRSGAVDWPHGYPSKRATEDFAEMIRRQYGGESNAFRSRVLGEFPKSDEDTVIPYEWIESARQRDIQEDPHAPKVWGLDVARFGGDRTVLSERTNRRGRVLDVWGQLDLMETAGRVKSRWDDTPGHLRPRTILVDVIGMGGGVVDRLRELGLPVRGINVGESAAISDKFQRARSELWWRTREWLERQDVGLDEGTDDREDPQEILAIELSLPRYQFTSTGKIAVEPKENVKKRRTPPLSPDVADSFVLTFAEDLSAAMYGSAGSSSWGEPIKRGVPNVF